MFCNSIYSDNNRIFVREDRSINFFFIIQGSAKEKEQGNSMIVENESQICEYYQENRERICDVRCEYYKLNHERKRGKQLNTLLDRTEFVEKDKSETV